MGIKKHARVTEYELAKLTGKDVRTILRREKTGAIVRGPDGLFDAALSVPAVHDWTQAGRPRKLPAEPESASAESSGGDAPPRRRKTTEDWLRAKTREQARIARLDRMERQRALVSRSAVEARWTEVATMVRDQLLEIGPTLAGRLAAESDAAVCSRLVSDEIRRALSRLADAPA